eukprot:UN12036
MKQTHQSDPYHRIQPINYQQLNFGNMNNPTTSFNTQTNAFYIHCRTYTNNKSITITFKTKIATNIGYQICVQTPNKSGYLYLMLNQYIHSKYK